MPGGVLTVSPLGNVPDQRGELVPSLFDRLILARSKILKGKYFRPAPRGGCSPVARGAPSCRRTWPPWWPPGRRAIVTLAGGRS